MLNPEQVQETINDVQELKAKILDRHQSDLTFCLRTETVFNQYVNSLSFITGTVIQDNNNLGGFTPQPLKSVIGKPVHGKSTTKLELPVLTTSDEDSFKESIKNLHDTFLDRENIQLLDSLRDIEIRGVAKIAGLEDYREAKIDGAYVDVIKAKITANQNLEAEREQARLALKNGSDTINEPVQDVIVNTEPIIDPVVTEEITANQNLEADKVQDPVQDAKGDKSKTQNTKK